MTSTTIETKLIHIVCPRPLEQVSVEITPEGTAAAVLEKAGLRVLFAGDTAYTDAFARVRESGPVDLAILPIGAYDPWIYNHASPEEAWRM